MLNYSFKSVIPQFNVKCKPNLADVAQSRLCIKSVCIFFQIFIFSPCDPHKELLLSSVQISSTLCGQIIVAEWSESHYLN